jgi:hypothetical protein
MNAYQQRGAGTQAIFSIALGVLLVTGCEASRRYDAVVTGTVTVGGELAPGGTVTFHPVGGGPVATANINSDGTYAMRTGQGNLNAADGGSIPSGEYVVTAFVSLPTKEDQRVAEGGPPATGPAISAAKYRSKETSDLRQTVSPGEQVINLELERAAPVEEEADDDAQPETAQEDAAQ